MILAGLDMSLRSTGVVIAMVDGGTFGVVHIGTLSSPNGARGLERICWVTDRLTALLARYAVEECAIEGYAFSKLSTHAHEQGELGGVLRYRLWQARCPWWEVPPATLKKYVSGKGNAPKDVMLREVYRRWGEVAENADAADAYALARALAGHHTGHARKSDADAWGKARRVEPKGGQP